MIEPTGLLNFGVSGVLLLVILWQIKLNGDLRARLNYLEDVLIGRIDNLEAQVVELKEPTRK